MNGSHHSWKTGNFVSISGHISSTQVIQTGFLHGSVLGSFLFLLYINDLKKSIKNSRPYHFADDTNILLSNKSLEILGKKNEPRSKKSFAVVKSKQAFSECK